MSHLNIYVNSRNRQQGTPSDFQMPPVGFLPSSGSSTIQLRACTIPNAQPTIMTGRNSTPTVNGVTTTSVPQGYYTGGSTGTAGAALQTFLAAISTGTTVTVSDLTGKVTINVGATTALLFTENISTQSSSLSTRKNQTERFLEVFGIERLTTTVGGNPFTTIGKTLSTSTTYYGYQPMKLNGTDFVEVTTDLSLKTYHTTIGNDNIFARIPMSGSYYPTVTSWESTSDDFGYPIVSNNIQPRLYLIDEWGDPFDVPINLAVSYVFKLNTDNN